MSIVPSPGQMGPGTGSIGSVLMKHPTLFKGLGMGPALMGLGVGITIADLQRAQKHGFGWDVKAFRDKKADQLMTHIMIPVILRILPSSGGGGPGESPISTVVPPSIEETGEILSDPGIEVEVPSSPQSEFESLLAYTSGTSRKRCPPGYRWNGRRCVKKG
jgi:hypothetical protein